MFSVQSAVSVSWQESYICKCQCNVMCAVISDDIRYYKGKFKVRVLTESKGDWIVEALEPFEDIVYGENVKVKTGERRFVAPNLLLKKEGLPPPVKEHTYELKMEKKLKKLVEKEEEKKNTASS